MPVSTSCGAAVGVAEGWLDLGTGTINADKTITFTPRIGQAFQIGMVDLASNAQMDSPTSFRPARPY